MTRPTSIWCRLSWSSTTEELYLQRPCFDIGLNIVIMLILFGFVILTSFVFKGLELLCYYIFAKTQFVKIYTSNHPALTKYYSYVFMSFVLSYCKIFHNNVLELE